MSERIRCSNTTVERTQTADPISEYDEVRRWYAVLKFCPPDSFDRVESRWNQPY